MRTIPRLRTATLISSLGAATAGILFLLCAATVTTVQRDAVAQQRAESLLVSARQLVARINRGLAEQWRDHHAIATIAATQGLGGPFQEQLDTALALNDRLAWVGVASPDGRVLAASNRVLEGQDVSTRPWFRAGLTAPFAGDLHDAPLLGRVLPPRPDGEPIRLIDYASPLRRSDGALIGVLGSHVDWHWVRSIVQTAPLGGGGEALLIAADGAVLAGPAGVNPAPLGRFVGTTTPRAAVVEWADGGRFEAVAVGVGGEADAPSFGWVVVVRQPVGAPWEFSATLRSLAPIAGVALLMIVVAAAVGSGFGRRLAALAQAAEAMAAGRLDRPVPESRATREIAILGEALARLDRHGGSDPAGRSG